jgi:hypothetical protein
VILGLEKWIKAGQKKAEKSGKREKKNRKIGKIGGKDAKTQGGGSI